MSFTIEKATVTAVLEPQSRVLFRTCSRLKQYGLDAESELANILSSEILSEINREVVREVNLQQKQVFRVPGGVDTVPAGTFNLDVDVLLVDGL